MRAREPDWDGFVERDGVKVGYELFGDAEPAILLLTPGAILHAQMWKAQVPYLARHFQVLAVEPRGNGRADRPPFVEAYTDREYVEDAVAAMDATGVDQAVVVGLSRSGRQALQFAAWHPERALGVVAFAPACLFALPEGFDEVRETYEGWGKFNLHYVLQDHRGFLEFWAAVMLTEPHSTKQREDAVAWGLDTDAETLLLASALAGLPTRAEVEAVCRQVRCPVLIVHGDGDIAVPHEHSVAIAEWTGGELVTVRGGGHVQPIREPVLANLLIRELAERVGGRPVQARAWTRARSRRKRALFLSSPIGLGHALRDIAIAGELRRLHPDLEIEWLTQHPVTRVLEEHGERVHPASRWLASESAHIETEAAEHDLHAFQAIRRMDEILVANFMVFHDLVAEEHYDLWIGDEAWDVDYFLHENPELKRAAFVWLTDFVGWLPANPEDAPLTADYNAEMVEQIARYPRLRDRSVFVGNPGDLVPDPLGPGLPSVRDWTEANFAFAGYVTGSAPVEDREAVRAQLGYAPDERVCMVTVGGSGVGGHLLRKVAAAYPHAEKQVPGLRMVVVTGPRIDPESLPVPEGVEVHGYVPALYRHLAACDVAVVQGGLTTTMELTAAGRPFLYFPLGNHFEQQRHVPHRLAQYGAGRRMDYAAATPETIGAAIAAEIGHDVRYRPVETDGAARAATLIADLL